MAKRIPLEILDLKDQRYSCHGCGDCCRDFSVQLRDEDLERLGKQGWEEKLGQSVTVEFRGRRYLRQQADGACLFLQEDGLCQIHGEFGFHEKPVACRLFPFNLAPDATGTHAGLNFACQSVRANRGASLESHRDDLRRALREVPESKAISPPRLAGDLRADVEEVDAVDGWGPLRFHCRSASTAWRGSHRVLVRRRLPRFAGRGSPSWLISWCQRSRTSCCTCRSIRRGAGSEGNFGRPHLPASKILASPVTRRRHRFPHGWISGRGVDDSREAGDRFLDWREVGQFLRTFGMWS
jgi:Fe-S-cluster containining protein